MKFITKIAVYITNLCYKLIVVSNQSNHYFKDDNDYKVPNFVTDKHFNRKTVKTKNKSTMTEDMNCVEESDNNNCKMYGNRSYSYYSYDQRVYNVYKQEENHRKSFFGANYLINAKNLFITFGILVLLPVLSFCIASDLLNWFAFHEMFANLLNNEFETVRSLVPV